MPALKWRVCCRRPANSPGGRSVPPARQTRAEMHERRRQGVLWHTPGARRSPGLDTPNTPSLAFAGRRPRRHGVTTAAPGRHFRSGRVRVSPGSHLPAPADFARAVAMRYSGVYGFLHGRPQPRLKVPPYEQPCSHAPGRAARLAGRTPRYRFPRTRNRPVRIPSSWPVARLNMLRPRACARCRVRNVRRCTDSRSAVRQATVNNAPYEQPCDQPCSHVPGRVPCLAGRTSRYRFPRTGNRPVRIPTSCLVARLNMLRPRACARCRVRNVRRCTDSRSAVRQPR